METGFHAQPDAGSFLSASSRTSETGSDASWLYNQSTQGDSPSLAETSSYNDGLAQNDLSSLYTNGSSDLDEASYLNDVPTHDSSSVLDEANPQNEERGEEAEIKSYVLESPAPQLLLPINKQTPFKGNPDNKKIFKLFRSIEGQKAEGRLSDEHLDTALRKIRAEPETYGFIDVKNAQHRELLYYHLLHQSKLSHEDLSHAEQTGENTLRTAHEAWQKEKTLSPDPPNTYKTAYLGAGSSIGYYIESLGKNADHSDSILIGTPEPWREIRGPGVILQPKHIITPKLLFSEETAVDDLWTKRDDFSQLLEEVFQASGIKREQQQITRVEKAERFYRITYGKEDHQQIIYAKEVIAGLGTGLQSTGEIAKNQVAKNKEEVEAGQKRIMNINIFTQLNQELVPEEQRSKTVIIMAGGTGLAEAVFYALDKGFQVKWVPGRRGANFAIGQPQDVVKLPYFRHLASVEKNPEQQQKYEQEVNRLENSSFLIDLYQIQDQNTFQNIFESFQNKAFDQIHLTYLKTAEHTDTGVVATLQNGETVTGDYLVYAMGADLSTFEIFDKNVLNNLEPLVDKNRRFQLLDGDTAPTTLGLKTKDDLTGSSLKIIGSMAARLVPRIDANHTMGQVLRYLPDNAVFNDVLPPIRSSIEAANNFLPYDINERVNYSVGDNQALATHIVANFPAIADLDLRLSQAIKDNADRSPKQFSSLLGQLVKQIVLSRKQKNMAGSPDGLVPPGPDVLPVPPYSALFQQHWEQALQNLNLRLKENELMQQIALVDDPQ